MAVIALVQTPNSSMIKFSTLLAPSYFPRANPGTVGDDDDPFPDAATVSINDPLI